MTEFKLSINTSLINSSSKSNGYGNESPHLNEGLNNLKQGLDENSVSVKIYLNSGHTT